MGLFIAFSTELHTCTCLVNQHYTGVHLLLYFGKGSFSSSPSFNLFRTPIYYKCILKAITSPVMFFWHAVLGADTQYTSKIWPTWIKKSKIHQQYTIKEISYALVSLNVDKLSELSICVHVTPWNLSVVCGKCQKSFD